MKIAPENGAASWKEAYRLDNQLRLLSLEIRPIRIAPESGAASWEKAFRLGD